ncbi:MAG: hypothetical protein GY842_07465 [bacterium]|nr:hypothetical protein [bacterium]
MATSKLTSQGQVTIPFEIRERLGLATGVRFRFDIDDDGKIVLIPEKSASEEAWAVDPEELSARIRSLLAKGSYPEACALARRAAEHFRSDERLQKLWQALDNRGKSRISSRPTEPSTEEEFAWLQDPPEWAHGKWVALVGREHVAVGETLEEVSGALRSQKLTKRPLVHRVE